MPWFHESADLCGKKYEVMFTINRCSEGVKKKPGEKGWYLEGKRQ